MTILETMGSGWWTASRLSVELRESPSATRGRLKTLLLRGEVRYRPDDDHYQAYPVRQAVADFLKANSQIEYNAAAVAQALPELGLTWEQMHVLLADLVKSDAIECWFGSAQ